MDENYAFGQMLLSSCSSEMILSTPEVRTPLTSSVPRPTVAAKLTSLGFLPSLPNQSDACEGPENFPALRAEKNFSALRAEKIFSALRAEKN